MSKHPLMKIAFAGLFGAAISLFATAPLVLAEGWTTDYAKAVEQAKTENKAILLDFTGSDWCGWCMKMKKETLDTPAFHQYAEKNLVLVEVDFPHNIPQSDKVKAQNQDLSQKFQVNGFPAFIILSKTGRLLGRQDGYLEGGPTAFLAELKKFYKGSPSPASGGQGDDFNSFFKKPAQSPTP
jgi:thioredoxin-related protein